MTFVKACRDVEVWGSYSVIGDDVFVGGQKNESFEQCVTVNSPDKAINALDRDLKSWLENNCSYDNLGASFDCQKITKIGSEVRIEDVQTGIQFLNFVRFFIKPFPF